LADPLAEILQSPLDEMVEPRIRGRDVLIVVGALALGSVIGWVAGASDDTPVTASTTTTSAATELPTMPPDFVDTGLGTSASVAWMYTSDADLLVGIALVTPTGESPADSGVPGPSGDSRSMGIWSVQLAGGERVDHTREMFDHSAPGFVTVEFADLGAQLDVVRALSLRPTIGAGIRVHNLSVPLQELPVEFATIAPLPATELVEQTENGVERSDLTWVTIDQLTIDRTNGSVAWSLDDPQSVRVMIDMAVTLDGDTENPVGLTSVSTGANFLQRPPPPASPARSGIEMLKKQPGTGLADYLLEEADLAITISWFRYAAAAIDIPLNSAALLDPFD